MGRSCRPPQRASKRCRRRTARAGRGDACALAAILWWAPSAAAHDVPMSGESATSAPAPAPEPEREPKPATAAPAPPAPEPEPATSARASAPESKPATEVVVKGDPPGAPIGPRDASVASSVLRRDRLVGPGLQPQDVLRTQPGVVVTESGGFGAPATAAIRGATAADTPVYLGGVRLNDDVGGTADLSLVPLWLIDHVEIYRGHVPLEADRLASGGAIFFEPRRPTKPVGGLGYYGGSWGTIKGWAYEGLRASGTSALVGVSAERSANRYPFVNDHGALFRPDQTTIDERRNADQRTLEGWALARTELGRGATLDVVANGIVREQGVPRLALVQSREARQESTRQLASIGVRIPLDEERRHVVESRTSLLIGASHYHDPLLELNLRTPELDVVGRRLEEALSSTWQVTNGLRLHPACNLSREWIERDPNNIPLGQAHRDFARLAVSADAMATSWLRVHALASAECHHTGMKGHSVCDTLEPSGRVGVELGQGRARLLANVGHYIRVPTLGEMYGIAGTVHGNPNLAPESSDSVDLGVRAQAGRGVFGEGAYLDAFVFLRKTEGLVAYQRAGEGFVVPYNVGQARMLGAEVLTGLRITPVLRAEVSATLLEPRDVTPARTTVNDVLPFRSRAIVAARLRADWRAAEGGRDGLSALGAEIRPLYQSSRYADPAGLAVIAAQTAVDVDVFASWFDGLLTARGRIADVFDAKRTDIIGYPLPGRSGYLGLEVSW